MATVFPKRVFIDSSTLQNLQRYGEFIYDGGSISPNDPLWSIPDGMSNIEALQAIMFAGQRNGLELTLSSNSISEVSESGRENYLKWALEVLSYWTELQAEYERGNTAPFTGTGKKLALKVTPVAFGYMSQKDMQLVRDAVELECQVFLTLDKKLIKNASHIRKELGLLVLQPIEYWGVLKPWLGLL